VLIRPPFVDDGTLAPAGEFRIVVDIAVRVRLPGVPNGPHVDATKTVEIPVVLPAVRVPAVLLVAANYAFGADDERVAVILRNESPHRTVSELVGGLNDLMDVLGGLRTLLPLVPIADGVGAVAQVLANTPRIYIAFGNVSDLETYGDLRSTHGAVLLLGLAGTKVTFFDDTDFADSNHDLLVEPTQLGPLAAPIGYVYYPSLNDSWGNSPESVAWADAAIDLSHLTQS